MLACLGVNAQRRYAPLSNIDFNYTVQNVVKISDRILELDLYLLDSDPTETMELATVQAGITVSPTIYNGGTLSASIITGFSELPTAMQPTSVSFTQSQNIIKLAGKTPPGAGAGPLVSQTGFGTKITRIRLTSTAAFTSSSHPGMAFTSSAAVSPSYATRVAIYLGGVNTQLTVTPGVNANVMSNPLLNGPTVITWDGSESTDWFTAANWTPPTTVPTATDDVDIPVVTNQPLIAGATLAVCKNMHILTGAIVTVAGKFSPAQVITNDGSLIVDNGSFIDNGISGSGATIYKKLMTNTNPGRWHYVSSPVSNGTAAAFLNDFLVNWWCPTQSWAQYQMDPDYPLAIAEGYAAYIPVANDPLTTFVGSFNKGASAPFHTCTTTGYCLVGNPFQSAIDLSVGVSFPSTSHTAWFWDPEALNYKIYVEGAPLPTHTKYAPAIQGFFIECLTPGNFQVLGTARTHNAELFIKDGVTYPNALSIKATTQVNNYSDETVVGFNSLTTTGYDANYDAAKIAGGTDAPQIYSVLTSGDKVAYNVQPVINVNTVVPMGFTCGVNGNMTLNASNLESFDANVNIFLEDLKEGTMQNLKVNPAYTFAYSTGDNANRFVLHFSNPTGINEHSTGVQVYSFESTIYINNLDNLKLQNVVVYDLLGKEVFRSTLKQDQMQSFLLSVTQGTYVVKVLSDKGVTTQKVSIN